MVVSVAIFSFFAFTLTPKSPPLIGFLPQLADFLLADGADFPYLCTEIKKMRRSKRAWLIRFGTQIFRFGTICIK